MIPVEPNMPFRTPAEQVVHSRQAIQNLAAEAKEHADKAVKWSCIAMAFAILGVLCQLAILGIRYDWF